MSENKPLKPGGVPLKERLRQDFNGVRVIPKSEDNNEEETEKEEK